jgi:peptidyl-tRNA hydrolase
MFGILEMYEEIEYTKGLIRIRISKKNRQHNGQKNINKRTNNDLQNIHKMKDRVTRTPGVNSDAPEG